MPVRTLQIRPDVVSTTLMTSSAQTYLIGTKFLSSAVMTVLATPRRVVDALVLTRVLAIGRLIEPEAVLGILGCQLLERQNY